MASFSFKCHAFLPLLTNQWYSVTAFLLLTSMFESIWLCFLAGYLDSVNMTNTGSQKLGLIINHLHVNYPTQYIVYGREWRQSVLVLTWPKHCMYQSNLILSDVVCLGSELIVDFALSHSMISYVHYTLVTNAICVSSCTSSIMNLIFRLTTEVLLSYIENIFQHFILHITDVQLHSYWCWILFTA